MKTQPTATRVRGVLQPTATRVRGVLSLNAELFYYEKTLEEAFCWQSGRVEPFPLRFFIEAQ